MAAEHTSSVIEMWKPRFVETTWTLAATFHDLGEAVRLPGRPRQRHAANPSRERIHRSSKEIRDEAGGAPTA